MADRIDFQNAARQARHRARERNGTIPVQAELDKVLLALTLIQSGLLIDEFDENRFKEATSRWIAGILEVIGQEIWQEAHTQEFFNMARFIALRGGSSLDPETWADFRKSDFSLIGRLQRMLVKRKAE